MRKLLTCMLLSIATGLFVHAQNTVEFIDSLTKVTLQLPEGCKVIRHQGFHNATVELEKSDIKIYSMKSSNGQQYSWDQVNNFDSKDTYGKLLKYERTEDKVDGWVRYYTNKTKQGRDYITCVVLVRGKDYAFYMTESAYKEEYLSIISVLDSASFPKSTAKVMRTKWFKWFSWVVEVFFILFNLLFFNTIKKMKKSTYWITFTIILAGAILWSVIFLNARWGSLFNGLLCALSWWVASECKDRGEAFEKVSKLFGD